jgi:hypothetical protein
VRCREAVAVDRVNPETYEVCLRCNAYRDRGRGAALPWFGHQIVLSAQRFWEVAPRARACVLDAIRCQIATVQTSTR